ncbi:MAG: hypothetical protein SOT07_08055 [Paludibacteraceae bacterium]|nr:hypothetical protein [Paludibacteraceae bacterium]
MKKSILRIALVAMVGAVVASCSLGTEPTFQENDLLGLWQEDGTEAFVRFTSEKDSTGVYKYGCEWDEGDGIFESDLTKYGNGWFKWKLVKADLTEIHLMEHDGAELPKVYTVSKLTDTELQYKDNFKVTHSFQKVVGK